MANCAHVVGSSKVMSLSARRAEDASPAGRRRWLWWWLWLWHGVGRRAHALLSRTGLATRLTFGSLLLCAALWGLLDAVQSRHIEEVVNAELLGQLSEEARINRRHFDSGFRQQAVMLQFLARTDAVGRHVARVLATPAGAEGVVPHHGDEPAWIPDRAARRAFVFPNVLVVADAAGVVRDVHPLAHDIPLAPDLPVLTPRLIAQSERQPHVISLDGLPVIVTAAAVGETGGRLVGLTVIGSNFLQLSLRPYLGPGRAVAIFNVRLGEVSVSSNPDLLAPGTAIDAVERQWLVTGRGFLDYGSSEAPLNFLTLMSRDRIAGMAAPFLEAARFQRMVLVLALSGLFTVSASVVAWRLRRQIRRLGGLSARVLGGAPSPYPGGDELKGLVLQVERLTSALVESRDALRRESAERIHTLEVARDQAEIVSRTKTAFLANTSHELRTPLNAIMGFSEAMLMGVRGAMVNAHHREYVAMIHTSAEHLLGIINDILDVSAVEAGKLILREDEVELADAIGEAADLVRERAAVHGVHLNIRLPPDLPGLWVDARRFKQILLNPLNNAIKFTPAGGSVTLGVIAAGAAQPVIVTIADTGIGMSPDELERAVVPFGQVDNSLTRRFDGTGLGLPLTISLVEMHGGEVRITSVKGAGTTVSLVFPASRCVLRRPVPAGSPSDRVS
jgi:signal transduction histidine kinase